MGGTGHRTVRTLVVLLLTAIFTGHKQLGTRRSKKCHVVFCIVHLLFTVKMLIFLQKEGHSNLILLVQYKKLTSNHGPQTFVAVRLWLVQWSYTFMSGDWG